MSRWSVILAGGVGSRFWPLSTPDRPKQLLPLTGDKTMLASTLARMAPIAPPERTLVLTNPRLLDAVRKLTGLPPENVIAEPRSAGTGPALAWAALKIRERGGADSCMICVHADWHVAGIDEYRSMLALAAEVAEQEDALVTVGIVPNRPDTGFGYIEPGDRVRGREPARRVARFVEKPDRETAARMVQDGYLWNSGIFAWKCGVLLDEIAARTPELAALVKEHADSADAFFGAASAISIDVGVLERSSRVLVLPGDFGWDDVGTWSALRRVLPQDEAGNTVRGQVYAVESRNNVVFSEDQATVLFGVNDMVVVSRKGITLVAPVELAEDLKRLLDRLPEEVRSL